MSRGLKPYSDRSPGEWIEVLNQSANAEDRYRALLAISTMATADQVVSSCVMSLRDAEPGVRALAAKLLGQRRRSEATGVSADVWRQVAADLAVQLTDDDPDVRFESARSLGSIDPGITTARRVLVTMLSDAETQPLMLSIVVTALGERPDVESADVIERLRGLLSHPQAEVRESVSAVVGAKSIAVQLIDPLIVALDDDEPIVRENAAKALGNSGCSAPGVFEALGIAERDEDEGVADAARAALSILRQG